MIVAGARTPIGRFDGGLSSLEATELGGIAIKGALERAGVPAEDVEYVIMGEVLQAGVGQIPARPAAVAGGIPMSVQAVTHQQGLSVRHERDRHRRPDDSRR